MDAVSFLDAAKADTENAFSDLLLDYKPVKGESEGKRSPTVWKMRISKSSAAQHIAPYVIHQVITTDAHQEEGRRDDNLLCLRSIFCAYNEDEQEGSIALLTMIERLRIHWLRHRLIDNRFELDMTQGIQVLIYPEDTKDFYVGEMVTYWKLPPIPREVILSGYNC